MLFYVFSQVGYQVFIFKNLIKLLPWTLIIELWSVYCIYMHGVDKVLHVDILVNSIKQHLQIFFGKIEFLNQLYNVYPKRKMMVVITSTLDVNTCVSS